MKPRLHSLLACGIAVGLLIALTGCAGSGKPLKGGHGYIPVAPQSPPSSPMVSQPTPQTVADQPRAEITQPENPAATSSQNHEATTEFSTVIPAGSQIKQTTRSVTPEGRPTETTLAVTVSEPVPLKQTTGTKTGQNLGPSQKDTSRELGARLSAWRPVQWVGILCLLGAGALCYFGWWTKAAIVGGGGVAMIVVAAIVPGNELLILGSIGAVVVIACLLVLYCYHKGMLDKALPDSWGLDRFPAAGAASTTPPAAAPTPADSK